jgi:Zn-dependent peptidase ImmA (M78 family)/transcriptional regulator with XRE-family HTH domain
VISEAELGRRLKAAREQLDLTQEQVAAELGLSRGALAQIELGMRAPNSLQLARLAEIYQHDLGEFLAEDFDAAARDALVALFRSDVQIADDPARAAAVRRCVNLAREYTHLEEILGIAAERPSPPEHDLPPPRTRWDAIQQGERLADEERDRLGLGTDPIRDIRTVLEQQGIRALEEQLLPENVSGVVLNDQRHGLSIIVNGSHHSRRRLFSYVHEYAHALADRDVRSLVSKLENRSELREVRANAFAAAFLMPDVGVRAFMRARGKGDARSVLQVFDESEVLTAQRRGPSRGQEVQLYDVVHVASHFGTSFDSALYRLLNLRIINEAQRERFAGQRDLANEIREKYFGEQELEDEQLQHPHKDFLFLALDAFRHAEISRGKLNELAALAEAPPDFDQLAQEVEAERDEEDEVLLPPTATPAR